MQVARRGVRHEDESLHEDCAVLHALRFRILCRYGAGILSPATLHSRIVWAVSRPVDATRQCTDCAATVPSSEVQHEREEREVQTATRAVVRLEHESLVEKWAALHAWQPRSVC